MLSRSNDAKAVVIFKTLLLAMIFFCCTVSLSIAALKLTDKKINATLQTVYDKYKTLREGKNADYIPELAKVNPNLFGIAIITTDGKAYTIGDANVPFAIESISKAFVYALALQDQGESKVTEKVGLNATGHAFNSVMAIEEKSDHLQNPLVNAGAIQITSLINGKDSRDKWQRALDLFKRLSDNKPYLGQAVYQSEALTNQHNRAISQLLGSYGLITHDPIDAVDRYTKACSIMVTAQQLALMGATLANQGKHPITQQIIFPKNIVRDVLAEMVINGLYENSGAWFWHVGLPAKSGVGGGILAIVPKQMAIVVFSPPLDTAGNSVRAQKVITDLAQRWHLHLLN